MRARPRPVTPTRLVGAALTAVALLGSAACSGEAPEFSQVEENEAPNNVETGENEGDDEG